MLGKYDSRPLLASYVWYVTWYVALFESSVAYFGAPHLCDHVAGNEHYHLGSRRKM